VYSFDRSDRPSFERDLQCIGWWCLDVFFLIRARSSVDRSPTRRSVALLLLVGAKNGNSDGPTRGDADRQS
jgi:hypothetical protein